MAARGARLERLRSATGKKKEEEARIRRGRVGGLQPRKRSSQEEGAPPG